ncbi:MAG: hypothetical protein HKO91_05565, partial [Desulfobacterales bacterium]|nr:hypothetical protein [Desulfobacterales bacterium]
MAFALSRHIFEVWLEAAGEEGRKIIARKSMMKKETLYLLILEDNPESAEPMVTALEKDGIS